MTQCSSR